MEPIGQMVGREKELEFLVGHMAKALNGEGGLVLVSGEAGAGKTTLCGELARIATKSGCQMMVGRCIPGVQSPYLPYMEAFFGQEPNPFNLNSELLSESRGKLLISVLDGLERLATKNPMVLWLEDLHWADSASIALTHFLARNIRPIKVVIVGTYRPEEINRSSSETPFALRESLHVMRREGICHELALLPLEAGEIKRLANNRLGKRAEERLLNLIADDSKGNPLFAVEMISFLVSTGQAMEFDGTWRLKQGLKIQIPSTIREIVLARIEKVPQEAKHILDCASVIGEWFELDPIEACLKIDRLNILENLDHLEKEFQVVSEDEGAFRFSHEKIKQVIYEQISPSRRKELHKLAGNYFERRLPNDELLGTLSYHFDQANDNDRCIRYSLSAGKYCLRRKAITETKSYLQLVLKRADGDSRFCSQRLEALEGLGDLGPDASTPKEWYSYYDEFLKTNCDMDARARVLAKAAACWDQTGLANLDKANELLNEAEELSDDPSVLGIIEWIRATLTADAGMFSEPMDHITNAIHNYSIAGNPKGIIRCRGLEMALLGYEERYLESRILAEELLPLAKEIADPDDFFWVENNAIRVLRKLGEVEQAKKIAGDMVELAKKQGNSNYWRRGLIERGLLSEMGGDYKAAIEDLKMARENALEFEILFYIAFSTTLLGLFEAECGHREKAEMYYHETILKNLELDPWLFFAISLYIYPMEAEIRAIRGDFQQSDEIYTDTIRCYNEWNYNEGVMYLCSYYMSSLVKRGLIDRAQEQYDEAITASRKIGCEKFVHVFAQRAGLAV